MIGVRSRRAQVSGVMALTPGERRVCELAVTGRSNRPIAQSLFVSLRTVETHLTHAYQKLGITGRAELLATGLRSRGPDDVSSASRAPGERSAQHPSHWPVP